MGSTQAWVAAMVIAVVSAVLVPVNAWLAMAAQGDAQALGQRRMFVQQTPQLARVIEVTAGNLARAALQTNDEAIRAMLTRSGITIQATPAGATPGPAPAATASPATPPAESPATTAPARGR